MALAIRDRLPQDAVVVGFVQVGLQADRQPDAMVGVRDLVDVFQLGAFDQQDAIGHRAAGFLLAQGVQKGRARDLGLDVAHAHVVLEVIAGLRIGGQAVDIAVIEDLARQPVIHEVVELGVGRFDRQAALALGDVGGVFGCGAGEAARRSGICRAGR